MSQCHIIKPFKKFHRDLIQVTDLQFFGLASFCPGYKLMRQEYIPLILINSTLLQRDPDSVSCIRHLFCTLRQRMAHHGRPQKRKQVNPHRAIRILQRNFLYRSIVYL